MRTMNIPRTPLLVLVLVFTAACQMFEKRRALAALESAPPAERARAARRLGELKTHEALPALIKASSESDEGLRRAAIAAIGQIGDVSALETIVRHWQRYPSDGAAVTAGLQSLGPAAETKLLEWARSDGELHFQAIRALGAIKSRPAVDDLTRIALTEEGPPSMAATAALEAIGDSDGRVARAAVAALSASDSSARARACRVAAAVRAPNAVPQLVGMLKHEADQAAAAAAEALGKIGGSDGIAALLMVMQQPGARTTTRKENGWTYTEANEQDDVRWAAADALGALGSAAVPALSQAIEHRDEYVRVRAARALGRTKDAGAVPALVKHMDDVGASDNKVQAAVASSLISLGDLAIPAMLPLVGDERVRETALNVLGNSQDPRAVAAVIAALDDRTESVVDMAASQLAMHTQPEATKALDAAFDRRNYRAIRGAMPYFIGRGTPGSESVLLEAINKMDESYTNSSSVEAMLNSGNPALVDGARAWVKRHPGYSITPNANGFGFGAKWGSGRQQQ